VLGAAAWALVLLPLALALAPPGRARAQEPREDVRGGAAAEAPVEDLARELRRIAQQLDALAGRAEQAPAERDRSARDSLLNGLLEGRITLDLAAAGPGADRESPARALAFLVIRPGSFRMGRTHAETEAAAKQSPGSYHHNFSEPPLPVTVAEPFFMAELEVTNAQYYQFLLDQPAGTGPPYPPVLTELTSGEIKVDDERWQWPVTQISWHDATAFCNWLSKRWRLQFRLPTEIEWEYAARGEKNDPTPWSGGDRPAKVIRAVGTQPRDVSWCLVRDLTGNVSEWCYDTWRPEWYREEEERRARGGKADQPLSYVPQLTPGAAPDAGRNRGAGSASSGSGSTARSIRGGYYGDGRADREAATRRYKQADTRSMEFIGFRPVLVPRMAETTPARGRR
jgi:serine/threonine-protein kinase